MQPSPVQQQQQVDVFWGELAAGEHCVHIYEDNEAFLDSLEGFAAGGIRQGDAIVLIATPGHLSALEARLTGNGFNVDAARARNQYIALDAEATLAKFMVAGWPDDALFAQVIGDVLKRAMRDHKKVRAFGEMVALMWARGECGATVRLEHLWSTLCHKESFSVFCAYPRTGFTQNPADSIAQVCAAHSKVYAL
jgi:hypothetical protein